MSKVELGDKVKDQISGFTGIVVGITKYITGCDRATIDPGCKKDGEMMCAEDIDVMTLKVTKKKAVVVNDENVKTKKAPAKKKGASYSTPGTNRRY